MHVITATFDGSTVEPDGSLICDVIAIPIAEFPDVGRGPHVDCVLMDEYAFRERQALGEDGRMIKNTIAVPVDQPQYTMTRFLELIRGLVRVPRAIRDVERAIHVEIHVDGTLHQGRSSNTLQHITIGKRKGMRGELCIFHAVNRHGGKEKGLQYEAGRYG